MRKYEFEDFEKYLIQNNIKYSIDRNPSKEKIELIKQKIKNKEEKLILCQNLTKQEKKESQQK
jgi:hypothetical protein